MTENVKTTTTKENIVCFCPADRFIRVSKCSSASGHLAGVPGGAGGPVPAPPRGNAAPQTAYSQTGRQDQEVRRTHRV